MLIANKHSSGDAKLKQSPQKKQAANLTPKQSEAELTRAIRAVLKQLGIWHYKVHQGLGSTPGIPDIVGIYQGKFLGIEIKTKTGKLMDKQAIKLKEIEHAGGIALVARSVDDLIDGLGVRDRFLF